MEGGREGEGDGRGGEGREGGREGGEGRGGEGREGRVGEGRGGQAIEHMQRPSAADLRPVSQFMYQTRHVLRNNALGVYAAQQWYVLRST